MAETQTYNWDEVDVDESITADEQKASENISNSTPVGKFLCTIVESTAKENAMKEYTCIAANWKMRIDSVLEIEQPVFDDKGVAVKRDGQQLMKVLPVADQAKKNADALNAGRFIFDSINLHNPKEKEAMKKRRIFIAKKAGIITSESQKMTGKMWGPGAIGLQVVVTTEWNSWVDKETKEKKRNVKVAWDGYDYPEIANAPVDDDFSSI
ncbi:MAG TPA: hypothetical protein DCR95_07215 [Desulfobacter sp.]|nr:hypothetical protein [Desulfobacter sp.]